MNIDKLEEMPVREATHRHRDPKKGCSCAWCQEKRGDDYPWDRVRRWLIASRGDRWNAVIGDFVRLEWVPVQYRAYHKLAKDHVSVNTFIREGKVWFYPTYGGGEAMEVDQEHREVLYVHPLTKDLCYKAKTPKTHWGPIERERRAKTIRILGPYHQFLKLNGIWYEVKGTPSKSEYFNAKKYGPNDPMLFDKPVKGREQRYWDRLERPTILLKRQLNSRELRHYKLANTPDNEYTRKFVAAGKQRA